MLKGKTCLVTGASSGIGRAVAERFAREGASLLLVARRQDLLQEVAHSCIKMGSASCEAMPADLADDAQLDQLCEAVLRDHGALDCLVNNAGMGAPGTPLEGDPDAWAAMVHVNLLAPMRMTRRLAPAMAAQRSGVVINIGSVAGVEPMTGSCAYAASKWGLRGWSLSCYQALRHSNVKVMLINPAFVNTPMVGGRDAALHYDRMIQPADIAEACLLPFSTSGGCVPEEVTLRLTLSAYKQQG